LIELVGTDTRKLLDTLYPETGAPRRFERPTICVPRSGVVTQIHDQSLVRVSAKADCVLTLVPMLGEFVPAGAPLFEVEGPAEGLNAQDVIGCVEIGLERTLDQDLAYGLRMLVDIAERSV